MIANAARASAQFRFYEELNDFLAPELRKREFAYAFDGTPSVKDAIEAIGVPHSEVDLVLVDGESVDFTRRLAGGERVAVYPMFERLDVAPLTRLRPRPLRHPRFLLDVHLGKLARLLRLIGFDAAVAAEADDAAIVRQSLAEARTILTRDRGLLKRGEVTHGYWVRATDPRAQLREIVGAFDLAGGAAPFTRCLQCNGVLGDVAKEAIAERLPPHVREHFDTFARCADCDRIYWRGTHWERLRRIVDEALPPPRQSRE